MITLPQYFAGKPRNQEQEGLATDLLDRVNDLIDEYERDTGWQVMTCPNTGSQVSGSKNGQGDGGFRLPTATTGSLHSSHKEARAVDVYDPDNRLEQWVNDDLLEVHGLYREAPDATPHWVHLTTRPPGSGRRTFEP